MEKICILTPEGVKQVYSGECGLNKTLVFLEKFCENRVTTDPLNPDLVKVKSMDDFFKEFTTDGAFHFHVEFDDGTNEEIQIRNMQGFEPNVFAKGKTFQKEFHNHEKLLYGFEKALSNKKSSKEIIENSNSINKLLTESNIFDNQNVEVLKSVYSNIINNFPFFPKIPTSYNLIIKLNGIENFFSLGEFAAEQKHLLNDLQLLRYILNEELQSWAILAEKCHIELDKVKKGYDQKILKILDAIRLIEKTCYYVNSYFLNAQGEKSHAFKYLTIIQVDENDFSHPNSHSLQTAKYVLKTHFDNYNPINSHDGFVVVPELAKDVNLLKRWSKVSSDYSALLITDYPDLSNFNLGDNRFEPLEWKNLNPSPNDFTGVGDGQESTCLTVNHSVVRLPREEHGEEKPVVIPNSLALAGIIGRLTPFGVAAGFVEGKIFGVQSTTHDLLKSDSNYLIGQNLIPAISIYGGKDVIFFGVKTLYNGHSCECQYISTMHLKNWLTINIINYLNGLTFEFKNREYLKEKIKRDINTFLNCYFGENKPLKKFTIFIDDGQQNSKYSTEFQILPGLLIQIICYLHVCHDPFEIRIEGAIPFLPFFQNRT